MLTIYGCFRSRASRPLWLLAETGTAYRHVPVIQSYRLADPGAADAPIHTASPAFLAVNPQGQIPAMDDDGLVLTESLGITLYLSKRYGGDLGPRDLGEDALFEQWALVAATAVETPALEIQQAPAGDEGAARRAAAAQKLRRPFARLDHLLGQRDYLVGGRFTAADICMAECVRYAMGDTALMAEFPALSAWIARLHARPGFQAMWAARLAEPA